MLEPRQARYQWGQAVAAAEDLFNDGSHPEAEEGALLVPQGTPGEIVQIGHHTEANLPIYLVEYLVGPRLLVLGCLEEELVLAPRGGLAPALNPAPESAPG